MKLKRERIDTVDQILDQFILYFQSGVVGCGIYFQIRSFFDQLSELEIVLSENLSDHIFCGQLDE